MASTKKNGADLSAVGEVADTAVVYLYSPSTDEILEDADGNPFYVEVYGQDSEHYKRVDNEITDHVIKKQSRAGRSGGSNLTAEQIAAQNFQRVYKNVKNWYLVLKGKCPECTEANVKDILERYPWVRDQVDAAIHDRKNFLTGSSAN